MSAIGPTYIPARRTITNSSHAPRTRRVCRARARSVPVRERISFVERAILHELGRAALQVRDVVCIPGPRSRSATDGGPDHQAGSRHLHDQRHSGQYVRPACGCRDWPVRRAVPALALPQRQRGSLAAASSTVGARVQHSRTSARRVVVCLVGRQWHPSGDLAVIDLRSRGRLAAPHAAHGPLQPPGWNHPGPLLFWMIGTISAGLRSCAVGGAGGGAGRASRCVGLAGDGGYFPPRDPHLVGGRSRGVDDVLGSHRRCVSPALESGCGSCVPPAIRVPGVRCSDGWVSSTHRNVHSRFISSCRRMSASCRWSSLASCGRSGGPSAIGVAKMLFRNGGGRPCLSRRCLRFWCGSRRSLVWSCIRREISDHLSTISRPARTRALECARDSGSWRPSSVSCRPGSAEPSECVSHRPTRCPSSPWLLLGPFALLALGGSAA